jgi:hypothetical protein
VLDAVLEGGSIGTFGVAPEVFGDEFFFAAGLDRAGMRQRLDGDSLPTPGVTPAIADKECIRVGVEAMAHGHGFVGLAVEPMGDESNCSTGNKLADEDDSAFAGSVWLRLGDVEAEIHFFEAGMEGNGDAFDADTVEEEAHERDVAAALVEIEFEAGREPGGEDGRVHFILRHDELAPFSGEEGRHRFGPSLLEPVGCF